MHQYRRSDKSMLTTNMSSSAVIAVNECPIDFRDVKYSKKVGYVRNK